MSKQSAIQREKLPEWDLGDFYASPSSPAVEKDFTQVEKLCKAFQKTYQGKVGKLSGASLAKAISDYEVIQEILGKLGSYAGLLFAKNMTKPENAQFYQNTSRKIL